MPNTNETRRAGGAAGLGTTSCLAADSSENTPSQSASQEAIVALQRDFAAEALRVVAIKASHAADDVLLGDDQCAERGIRIVISHVRAASAAFREMQRPIDGPADSLLAEPAAGGAP